MNVRAVLPIVRILGGVVLATLTGIGSGAPLAGWLHTHVPVHVAFDLQWLGWLVIISAIALITSAQVSFVRFGGGTGTPNDPAQRLVARGPYRWVRNPLYISGNALLWGTALVHNSAGLLAFAVVIALGFHLFVVFHEEPQLEKRYGDVYRAYKMRVPRWRPRIPKSN